MEKIRLKIKALSPRIIFSRLILLALIGSVAALGYFYYQTRQEVRRLSSIAGFDELAKREVEQVVEALGKLAVLPDEEPIVATVTDKDALLKQSDFYKNAENGDRIIVYPNAKVAYIYSPTINKIVNVGPFTVTDDTGLAGSISLQIETNIKDVEILKVADAGKTDYISNLVVDLSGGKFTDMVKEIAELIGGQVGSNLPESEAPSDADILVIVGKGS
ncbi:MAG: hypothetical protein UV51_C0008G0025 [Candidatus Woesebacteria bacterium GW2011_GWC1_42_9]|nr:MAG: hypothetical protein UV51_C0008G0025 [Candidatus Woesebacteria bacterium GW2011_GWC1_42_9]